MKTEGRKIIFRGQTRKLGEKVRMNGDKLPGNWVYGGIFCGDGDFSVIYGWESGVEHNGENLKKFTIYTDTICQYTGITDKAGTMVFEGDIVKTKYGRICVVVWFVPQLCFDLKPIETMSNLDKKPPDEYDLWYKENIEVIGNIYDNPDLVKEVESNEQLD